VNRLVALISACSLAATNAGAQEWAKQRLEQSPRHLEWVKVTHGDREVACFVAFPEVKERVTAVVVIHEIFGLTDWVRSVTDQLAEAGYVAIAPDLLSGMAPGGGGTADFKGGDAVRKAITSLPPKQITADLNAVAAYVAKLPACNGKVTVAGFCWGGGQAFRFATNSTHLKAAFPFYGPVVENADDIARIQCPVYAFFAENDARINASIPKAEKLMKEAGKSFDLVIYEGAGHGFMRAGEDPKGNAANRKARHDAWERWKKLLREI
jgi:carboxymethylenebutenolidase